jgi:hypothetical protein
MNALNTTASVFYYNPTTVSFGKIEFKKKGNRTLGGNWRTSSVANTNVFSKY